MVHAPFSSCNSLIVRTVAKEEGHVGPISPSASSGSNPCFPPFKEMAVVKGRIQENLLQGQQTKMKGSIFWVPLSAPRIISAFYLKTVSCKHAQPWDWDGTVSWFCCFLLTHKM